MHLLRRINTALYYLVYVFWFLASLLPLRVLYFVSDLNFLLVYYLLRYRRKIVRSNLTSSFPEKDLSEIQDIEKKFYRHFCDIFAETVKLFSISEKQMRRRLKFENADMLNKYLNEGRSVSLFLGHCGNWEWLSAVPLCLTGEQKRGQIYHALENPAFDKLFLYLRSRFTTQCITMEDTFRTVVGWKRQGFNSCVGYISDQVPMYQNIHYFTEFLNHDTPVFTGAERITRLVDSVAVFIDFTRTSRGHYTCRFELISDNVKEIPTFGLTEKYIRLLEANIRKNPPYWLWSHNRWKRTREEFNKMFSEEEREKRLSRL